MLDAPCGSFLWMSIVMKNVTAEFRSRGEQFRYHGVDVVTDLINTVREKYANLSEDLEFSVCDFSRQDLPQNYDLIFSRDALMHLSYEKVYFMFVRITTLFLCLTASTTVFLLYRS